MKITSSKQVYDCGLFRVTEDVAVDPKTKFQIKRSVMRHIGSAVMMAVDDKKRVLLVRQYRLPRREVVWELPAGRPRPRRGSLQAAKRELKEETGYAARKVDQTGIVLVSPGFVQERITHLFLAEDLTAGEVYADGRIERIEARWYKRKELATMIAEARSKTPKPCRLPDLSCSKVGQASWPVPCTPKPLPPAPVPTPAFPAPWRSAHRE
jgi:ADP-ribose pyrophosphatase